MYRLPCALVFVIAVVPMFAHADSIWERRNVGSAYLFVDTRARRLGDLVTIAIAENTGIQNKDERDASKATNAGGTFNFAGGISGTSSGANRVAAANLSTNGTSQRGITGKSSYNVNQLFTDSVTATVVQVLPNGNLVVEGYRKRIVGQEVRTLKVSGVIRSIDIGPGNVIQSSYVAEFHITYLGKGDQSSFSNAGWFGRAINHLWPF